MNFALTAPLNLAEIPNYFKSVIATQASQLDQDADALRRAFQQLGQQGLLCLNVSTEKGGRGWQLPKISQYTEQLARYSGALAFLQTQHQSAVSALAASANEALYEYLPAALTGARGIGVGFSQLRRSQSPPVTAGEVQGGYRVQGTIPWITGFGIFQQFMLGAQLPDGRAIFALVDFVPQPGLRFSAPMSLCALQSTQTVSATCENYFVPSEFLIDIKPAGWLQTRDRKNPLSHSFFALGCARAGLDILEAAQTESIPEIVSAYSALDEQLNHCRTATYQALGSDRFQEMLTLRSQAINLAVRCAHAAVTVSRGAANYADHPAQRVYREALAFTVFGQNTQVMTATIEQIARG
ncbi:MAG: acyl-CoA dehydrogenase family protein [Cyanobacteria bacterium P01_H01_bin.15]